MNITLKKLILNFYYCPIFVIASLVVILVFTLWVVVCRPFLTHRAAMRLFRNLTKIYGKVVVSLAYPWVRVKYIDDSKKVHTPCVYVCNHRSASDPFLMNYMPNEIVQTVNKWPFRLPVIGILARFSGYLSIREMPIEEFYDRAGKLLSEGVSIVFFPEGTRSASSKMGPFNSAAFRLAQKFKVPVVPLCLTGNENIPLKGSLVLNPGLIKVHKLDAVMPEDFKDMKPFALKNMVRLIIERETALMEGRNYAV